MQLPRFIQNLGYTASTCMCACTFATHTCPRVHIDSFLSLSRREFVTVSRLVAVSLHPPRLPLPPPYLLFFEFTVIPFCFRRTTIQGCIESHRCTCTRPIVYLLDLFTLKVPSDESSRKPRTHGRSAGKLLLSRVSR